MRLTNLSGLPAQWTVGFESDGREMLIVVAKATYRMPTPDDAAAMAEPQLCAEQVPLVEADQFTGEPGLSAPLYETDFAHHKPACDILLVGSAHAPQRRPVQRLPVGLSVGAWRKQLVAVGPRHWRKHLGVVTPSEPEPFASLALSYDTAFGGTDRTREAEGLTETFLDNPVGRGYWRHTDDIDGQPLASTECPGEPITQPQGPYTPMAFSPVGRNWRPRCRWAGTYDQQWLETTAPLWPADFDPRYFQAAPADQTVPYLSGGEEVTLFHLTPDGVRRFRLPTRRMPVTFIPYRGRDVVQEARLDTLVLEPELQRFTLTWRTHLALGRSVFDVDEVVLGETSHAWQRARQFPGKDYHPGLGALVAARRARGAAR